MADDPHPQGRQPDPPEATEHLLQHYRQELQKRFALPPARPPRRPRKVLHGALTLLLIGAALLWLDPAYRSESHFSRGQRQMLTLADGSQALLDINTQLQINWHLRSRRLILESGQVRLDVQRQPWRPLRVDAGTLQVEVLGTTFSLLRDDKQAQVLVLEGLVAVSDAQGRERTQLRAGQQLATRAGRLEQVQRVDPEVAMAWTQGRLVFQRTPLADALVQLQRYHPAPIRLVEPTLAGLPVSGALSILRVAAFLKALPALLPVTVTQMEGGSLTIDKR